MFKDRKASQLFVLLSDSLTGELKDKFTQNVKDLFIFKQSEIHDYVELTITAEEVEEIFTNTLLNFNK